MRPLYVIGTGGFAKEVAQLATELNRRRRQWSTIQYLCEDSKDIGMSLPFGSIAGTDDLLNKIDEPVDVVIGIGEPKVRARLGTMIATNPLITAPNLIHHCPGIDIHHVRLGQGNFVARGVAMTCDIDVGSFNLFNYNCTVGHDAQIGSFNVINPGSSISGHCRIGDQCLIGTGARILPRLSIANGSVVGAAALVTRSIHLENLTVVGIPARALVR